ncbi:hypothetical protein ESCO_005282 [Escovopsis weberi]|uniref:VOC domain-containing protein n=1 Tax=Escovopsis weberi TaxID=150374 RepID=A0A0M8N5N4_ESCWE|nr:hypothetical protein ESCO_005282 [Escovopsis weberi]
MTIDHMTLNVPVGLFQECLDFYAAALQPLGYTVRRQLAKHVIGLGYNTIMKDAANFFIVGVEEAPNHKMHLAFTAPDREAVAAFHAAAVAAGGKDNGEPGSRAYHPFYFGSFVHDPAGNNIEAVCHKPPASS